MQSFLTFSLQSKLLIVCYINTSKSLAKHCVSAHGITNTHTNIYLHAHAYTHAHKQTQTYTHNLSMFLRNISANEHILILCLYTTASWTDLEIYKSQ